MTGSGKTTTAARLGELTGLPVTEADHLTWRPGWVPVPPEEQRRRFSALCAEQEWILDTAYTAWADVALARAELVVALDWPRWLSAWRLLRRTVGRVRDGRTICGGNVETWRTTLSRDSILLWHLRTFRGKRDVVGGWEADPDGPPVLRFTRPGQLERWLRTVAAEG